MRLPERKLHRLKNYDYSSNGCYFITICTLHRECILSTVVGNAVPGVPPDCPTATVLPTEIGKMVIECWNKMSDVDENVSTDRFCLMPNHIHGIIIIKNQPPALDFNDNSDISENHRTFSGCLGQVAERRGRRSLQDLVRGFKSVTTRGYNKMVSNCHNGLWQKSYYDRIIRNADEYRKITEYIENNPQQWKTDRHNTAPVLL